MNSLRNLKRKSVWHNHNEPTTQHRRKWKRSSHSQQLAERQSLELKERKGKKYITPKGIKSDSKVERRNGGSLRAELRKG